MKSIWKPGTRVRVRASVKDGTAGMVGVIEEVGYAQKEFSTSVLLDTDHEVLKDLGAFYYDDELEPA
ncbi:hypothetical protein [Streptomyces rubiginosohelvolus]|uniref:hypothetical protein n=1 Tax=Streptomyces rubiginosohelvolus TaxID=67362 RepID=UPI00364AC61E